MRKAIITGNNIGVGLGINNQGLMITGNGNDRITGITTIGGASIFNSHSATIDTGDGNDIIIGISLPDIYNAGTINTGNGNDSIISEGGFNGIGSFFLGDGKDYLKSFGSSNLNAGNCKDTLELSSGSYTVGISGTAVNFTKGSSVMISSEFEKLIAGSTTYDFTSLTDCQTIIVA